jgi:hypothetical protein
MRKASLLIFSVALSVSALATINSSKALFIKNSLDNLKEYILTTKQSSLLGNTYSVDEIYTDYANNELAANKKYKDKDLRIKTTINQVKEDVFGNAFIIAKIKSSVIGGAHFKVNEKDPRILELSKNSNVDLICRFDEYSLDSLSFNQCLFTDQFANKLLDPLKVRLLKFDEENYKPQSKVEVILSALPYAYPENAINKVCENDAKNCSMEKITTSKLFPKTISKEPINLDQYADTLIDKYGKEWFKSLPKFPTAE